MANRSHEHSGIQEQDQNQEQKLQQDRHRDQNHQQDGNQPQSQDRKQQQDEEKQPASQASQSAARGPIRAQTAADSNWFIAKLAQEILEMQGANVDLGEVAQIIERRCDAQHIPYQSHVVRRAIDSALVQRRRRKTL